jgi:hypothetical protein
MACKSPGMINYVGVPKRYWIAFLVKKIVGAANNHVVDFIPRRLARKIAEPLIHEVAEFAGCKIANLVGCKIANLVGCRIVDLAGRRFAGIYLSDELLEKVTANIRSFPLHSV